MPQRSGGPVRLFFAALNREADWLPILPALNLVLAEEAGRLSVHVIHDRALFEALQTSAKTFEPFCPYERYVQALRGCDVALLPLEPTDFNRMKSDLKFLECAACGVAALASPTVYESSLADGATGLIYRNAEEFADRLCLLVHDEPLAREGEGQRDRWRSTQVQRQPWRRCNSRASRPNWAGNARWTNSTRRLMSRPPPGPAAATAAGSRPAG